jgi:hypothetical protein
MGEVGELRIESGEKDATGNQTSHCRWQQGSSPPATKLQIFLHENSMIVSGSSCS